MDPLDGPTEEIARGLSRRQLLGRVGGGIAGLTLASLGLDLGRSAVAASGPISVRDLLRRISDKGCNPSHGIRVALPNDHPYISLRAVASRYAGHVVNFCEPLHFSVREEKLPVGLRVYLTGGNFTGGGMAAIKYESDIESDNRNYSVPVQPDGTFASVMDLGCTSPGMALYFLWATDVATGRKSGEWAGSYTCAQPTPPPPPTRPIITVSQQGSTFTVTGSGFLTSHAVYIGVTVRVIVNGAATLAYKSFTTRSDASGGIKYSINIPCDRGAPIYFTANDGRLAPSGGGNLFSNTVPLTCS